jgi:hypothetical protein
MEGELGPNRLEKMFGSGNALGGANRDEDLSSRWAVNRRRRSGRLMRGTSCSLHHFEPLGGEFQERLHQPDNAIHGGTRDPLPKAGGLSVRPPGRGAGGTVDGRGGTSPPGGAPTAVGRGTRPCHRGWWQPHVHILFEVSGVILLILTGTGQELPHDQLHDLRRPFENTSVKGSLNKAAHAVCNVEFVCLRQLSETAD